MQVHVVTDSSALFAHPQLMGQYPVTVIPNRLMIAGTEYREGVNLSPEQALELLAHQVTPPQLIPPSVDDYGAVYANLAKTCDAVVSVHMSRMLSSSWQNARTAAHELEGHLKITVVDSGTLDAAQGMIVRAALRIAEQSDDWDEIVRVVRSAIERVYSVYYVETPDYLMRNRIMTISHALLSMMNKMMPILTVEEGRIATMEKVKTRSQAVDRIIEFVTEFENIEDVLIVQPRTYMNEQTRALQERLSLEFTNTHFPYTVYSPSLAALLGVDTMGLVVLERELAGGRESV